MTKPSIVIILELPAIKITWLNATTLARGACQRANAITVDTLRYFRFTTANYYGNSASSGAKPAYLRARAAAGEARLRVVPLCGIVDLVLVENRDTYPGGDAGNPDRYSHNRVLVEVDGLDTRVPRPGPPPPRQRRHGGERAWRGREER